MKMYHPESDIHDSIKAPYELESRTNELVTNYIQDNVEKYQPINVDNELSISLHSITYLIWIMKLIC